MAPNDQLVTNINDLSESALLEVMEYLSLEELCVSKGVCRRFRKAANQTFERRYAGEVHFDDLIFNMPEIVCTINCFNPLIKSVIVNGSVAWELNTSILTMLIKKCNQLKKIRLICFQFDKDEMPIMKTLVQRLETIELLYCTMATKRGVNYNVFLKLAEKMKELVIIGHEQEIDLKCLNKRWAAMNKLEIISARLTDEEVLGHFLNKNPLVKYFSYMPNALRSSGRPWVDPTNINFATNLTEISIELNKNIDYDFIFHSLKKLQRIVIRNQGYDKPIHNIISHLAKLKTLKVVGLWNINFCDFLTLPKLNNIHTLELREIKSVFELKNMIYVLNKNWLSVKNLYLDHSLVRHAKDVEVFVENVDQLENLFLCNMRGFFIIPNIMQYNIWCSRRMNPLNIFVDSRHFMEYTTIDQNQEIVFKPFKSRIIQMVNVICGDNF